MSFLIISYFYSIPFPLNRTPTHLIGINEAHSYGWLFFFQKCVECYGLERMTTDTLICPFKDLFHANPASQSHAKVCVTLKRAYARSDLHTQSHAVRVLLALAFGNDRQTDRQT